MPNHKVLKVSFCYGPLSVVHGELLCSVVVCFYPILMKLGQNVCLDSI